MCLNRQWVLYIHFLLDYTIQECCLNIQLLCLLYHTCTYGSIGSVPHNWYKCRLIVYSLFLLEASCYKYCLVFLDVSISYILDLVDPYGRHYGLPFKYLYCILDIILLELVLFSLYGFLL